MWLSSDTSWSLVVVFEGGSPAAVIPALFCAVLFVRFALLPYLALFGFSVVFICSFGLSLFVVVEPFFLLLCVSWGFVPFIFHETLKMLHHI